MQTWTITLNGSAAARLTLEGFVGLGMGVRRNGGPTGRTSLRGINMVGRSRMPAYEPAAPQTSVAGRNTTAAAPCHLTWWTTLADGTYQPARLRPLHCCAFELSQQTTTYAMREGCVWASGSLLCPSWGVAFSSGSCDLSLFFSILLVFW